MPVLTLLLAGYLTAATAGAPGCVSGGYSSRHCASACRGWAWAPPSSALLFDAYPSRVSADQFAHRSGWPSTPAYYQVGQFIYFRERFFDQQGPGRNNNQTYRRFDTYRSGFGVR